ncbi:MAG TPA: hypothetical protein VGM07_11700 [Stellaceae bacterium]|jgi:hypothetical protein
MTDRLSLTNALADANIERQKAERIATEIFDAIHENVATKTDVYRLGTRIDQVETALEARISAVESALGDRIGAVASALGDRISAVASALGDRISAVEGRLRAEMREFELRLEARIDRTVIRLGSLIVVLAGVILAAIRYLPHA